MFKPSFWAGEICFVHCLVMRALFHLILPNKQINFTKIQQGLKQDFFFKPQICEKLHFVAKDQIKLFDSLVFKFKSTIY